MSNTFDFGRGGRWQDRRNRVGDAPADRPSPQRTGNHVGGDEGRGRLASNPSDIPAAGGRTSSGAYTKTLTTIESWQSQPASRFMCCWPSFPGSQH